MIQYPARSQTLNFLGSLTNVFLVSLFEAEVKVPTLHLASLSLWDKFLEMKLQGQSTYIF